jgi:hypothetical protein
VLGVEGHVEPGLAAFGRELADDVVLRDLAREDLVEELGGLALVDAAEAHARTAGQLHVDERLVGAEADAADFDELDVIAVSPVHLWIASIVARAPAPRPQVPAPT